MSEVGHWQGVYASKAVDSVSWFQNEPAPSLAMIAAAGVGADAAVIDVGGGASSLIDRLLWAGFHRLTVLDIASNALAAARARLGTRADAVNWVAADVTTWRPAVDAYDLWHDRAAFHFLVTEADRSAYLAALEVGLRNGGQLILATFAPTGPERCSGLPVQRYSPQALEATLGCGFELLGSRQESHSTPGGMQQNFTWTRFRKR